jgi:uncharacterized protein YggU (UPF0235/DUF167 family)
MSVRLHVRVHAGSQRPGLVGRLADGSLKVAVAEPPEDGKANRAVEKLVADVLLLERSRVKVVAGAAARLKQIEIEGADAADVERRITGALARLARPERSRAVRALEREVPHGQ